MPSTVLMVSLKPPVPEDFGVPWLGTTWHPFTPAKSAKFLPSTGLTSNTHVLGVCKDAGEHARAIACWGDVASAGLVRT